MLKIVNYIAKFGMAAARKKYGAQEVKQAAEVIKSTGLKRGKTSKAAVTSKRGPKKTPSKPSPRSAATKGTGKPKRPSEKATKTPGKPKTKSKGIGDFLGEMFGRKRTGKTPKRSDSQAYRDGVKAGQRKADEKLNPSLRNKEMAPRSIENRRLDVLRQIREAKASGSSPKMIERLQARAQNLKNMKSDRPDLTTMRGKFKDGGLSVKNKKSRSDDTLEFFELLKRNKLTSKSKKPKIKKMPFKIKPGAKKPKLQRGPFKIDGKNKKFIKKLLGN